METTYYAPTPKFTDEYSPSAETAINWTYVIVGIIILAIILYLIYKWYQNRNQTVNAGQPPMLYGQYGQQAYNQYSQPAYGQSNMFASPSRYYSPQASYY